MIGNRNKKCYCLVLLVALILLLAVGTACAQTGDPSGRGDYLLPADKTVNDDLYAGGNFVDLRGRVTGDVFAIGNNVAAEGPTAGDLFLFGRQVEVNGPTGNSIRAAGNFLSIKGTVRRGVLAAAQQIDLKPESQVGGNLLVTGQTIRIAGKVDGNLRCGGDTVTISGEIKGDAEVSATHLIIADGAKIDGRLTYRSPNQAEIASGAQIGSIQYLPQRGENESLGSRIWSGVLGWLALLACGAVLALLIPRPTRRVGEVIAMKPWLSIGLGAAGVLLPLFVVIILFVTVVGKTLGWLVLFGTGTYLAVAILLGKVFVGALLGGLCFRYLLKQEQTALVWSTLAGATILEVVSYIPYLGALVSLIVFLLTLGALLILSGGWFKREPEVRQDRAVSAPAPK